MDAPNALAAPLWQDMELYYDEAANHGVSLATLSGGATAIIEYDNLRFFEDADASGGSIDMEVFAFAGSNDLVFAYDNVTGGIVDGPLTIGAENWDGTAATALVNNADASAVIEDDTVVCLTFEEPVFDPAEFTYQVTVDAGTAIGTELVNEAEHTVDNPGAQPAVASDTVTVGKRTSATTLALNPTSINTGGSTSATATVTSSSATKPAGLVEFLIGGAVKATGTLDAAGKATATLSGFATTGTFPVTARYVGDGVTTESTSAPVNLVVSVTQPPAKVKPTITIKTKDKVEVGTKPKVKIVVSAPGVTPTGKVEVTVKSGDKTKTYKATLDADGKVKLELKKAKKVGKLKVKVAYSGDAAVESGTAKTTIKVVEKK